MNDEMLRNYGWPNRPCERCSDHPGCHNYGCQIKRAWEVKYRETYGDKALLLYKYPHSDAKIKEWNRQPWPGRPETGTNASGSGSGLNGGISLDTIVEMLEAGVLKSMPRDTIKGKERECFTELIAPARVTCPDAWTSGSTTEATCGPTASRVLCAT